MSVSRRIFAATYDRQTRKVEAAWLAARRQRLLTGLSGHVLEIGGGTGANLDHYPRDVELTVTEPEPAMLRRLERRARETSPLARVLRAPAEDLPFEDDTFDVAVSTLVLCGVNDQPRALRELHRVIRPGGELRLIEHVRGDDDHLARRQDRMNWLNRLVVHCDCNRSTLEQIRAAGFDIADVEHLHATQVPSFLTPWVAGTVTLPVLASQTRPSPPIRRVLPAAHPQE